MARHSLLLVDGDAARRAELARALQAAGFQVAGAASAAEAADGLTEPGFDLVLLDLALPDLDRPGLRQAIAPALPAVPESLEETERRQIARMLRHTGGNRRQAALLLGISRSTLLSKIRRYGLGAPP